MYLNVEICEYSVYTNRGTENNDGGNKFYYFPGLCRIPMIQRSSNAGPIIFFKGLIVNCVLGINLEGLTSSKDAFSKNIEVP